MKTLINSRKLRLLVDSTVLTVGLLLSTNCCVAEPIQIDGIEVECKGCANYGDGRCEIALQGAPTILPCAEALEQLLPQSFEANSAVSISNESLIRYLSVVRREPEASRIVLERLLQDPDAEKIFLKNLERILSWYSQPLRELMLTGKIGSQYPVLLKSIFEEAEDGTAIRTELRIIAALLNPKISIRDVSFQLGFGNVTYELERLRIWTTTAELFEHPWADKFKQIYNVLDTCKALDEGNSFPAACSASNLDKLGVPFAEFANKYVINSLKGQIDREMLDAAEILRRYAQTDYVNHRTETTHLIIIEAIQDLLANRHPVDAEMMLSDSLQKFLTFLAKNDSVIAENYIKLLLKLALTFWENAQYDNAIKAIDASFSVSAEPVSARAKLLQEFSSNNVELTQHQREKVNSFYISEQGQNFPFVIVVGVLATVLLFIFLLRGRIIRISRPVVSIAKVYNSLSFNERYELKEVLSYFGLTVSANTEDLGRAYRLRAKALHPDSQTGNIKEFNLLSSRYQRARKLLQKSVIR